MVRSALRILLGFTLSNYVGGLILTLSILSPDDILARTDQLPSLLQLVGMTALQCGLFSLPCAAPFLFWCERTSHRVNGTYIMAGSLLAIAAYILFFKADSAAPTLVQDSSFVSLLLSGLLSGATYWVFAGRKAGT